MLKLRIGTRASQLALAQTQLIAEKILKLYPDAKIDIVKIRTQGDKNMAPFSSDPAGIKGMFTFEIEQELSRGEIDFAVHSLKDLPANTNFPVIAYSQRANPFDAIVMSNEKMKLHKESFIIGSSSLRRRLQLERVYPEAKIIPVRGNINTRLAKLDDGEFSALVLASAGLERLGLEGRISRIFTPDEILPAPGQGILACQGRSGENYFYLEAVNDECSRDCALAERSFARELNAGCNVPVGAYAEILDDETLRLKGLFIDEKTRRFYRGETEGSRSEAELIGKKLAEVIMS